jgi:hypothetical protein
MQQLQASEWIDQCSKRLQDHWRTVDPVQLDDVAIGLWSEPRWRALQPEDAAVEWLRQGVLAGA